MERMKEGRWMTIAELLWQEEFAFVSQEVYTLLWEASSREKALTEEDLRQLFKEIFYDVGVSTSLGFEKVADVVVACVVWDPEKADHVLDFVVKLLSAQKNTDDKQLQLLNQLIHRQWASDYTFDYVNGLLLGVFKAINWLDENHYFNSDFDKKLAELIIRLIDKNNFYFSDDKKFIQQFSAAVRSYCRPFYKNIAEKNKEESRLAQIYLIFIAIKKINDRIPEEHSYKNRFSLLIIQELIYGIFSSLPTKSKLIAVLDFFPEIFPKDTIAG